MAPTGSGKSRFAVHRSDVLARFGRILHVLPMRALVEDLVVDLACVYGVDAVGYQASMPSISFVKNGSCRLVDRFESERLQAMGVQLFSVDHDPYLLHPYTVTTYDSYSLSILLAPVPEIAYSRYGHADLSLALLGGSLNVFDEIHLLSPDAETMSRDAEDRVKAWSFIATATKLISELEGRVLYSSATVTPEPIYVISNLLGLKPSIVLASAKWIHDRFARYGSSASIEFIDIEKEASDVVEAYREALYTEIVASEPSEILTRLCTEERYSRILAVLNSVERAIRVFDRARAVCRDRGYEVVLVHGRMSQLHRSSASAEIKKLSIEKRRFVVIATQVIEAGVDIDADALVSDIAPIDSLIQRVGRVLRHRVRDRVGKVVISVSSEAIDICEKVYGVDCRSLALSMKALSDRCDKRIDWRYGVPERCTVYRLLLQPLSSGEIVDISARIEYHFNKLLETVLFSEVEELDKRVRELDRVYGGSLVRDSVRVPLIVRFRGSIDIVEVPTWYAKKLAIRGLVRNLVVKILRAPSGDEIGPKLISLRALAKLYGVEREADVIRLFEQQPLSFTRRLVKRIRSTLREKGIEDITVVIEGFELAEGIYDEVRGLI